MSTLKRLLSKSVDGKAILVRAIATFLAVPGAPTTALQTTSAGVCTNGAHTCLVTFITELGETTKGTAGVARTVDGTHNKIDLSAIPVNASGMATGRNVYMSKAGTTTPLYLVAASPVIPDNSTTTYTVDVADANLSVESPAVNTSGATLIHTAVAGTTPGTYDELWLWAYNGHTADVVLTIELGGVLVPDNIIVQTIPFKKGLFLIVPGFVLQNAALITAFAATTKVITLAGFVNTLADA
jgi:hypothetical protein